MSSSLPPPLTPPFPPSPCTCFSSCCLCLSREALQCTSVRSALARGSASKPEGASPGPEEGPAAAGAEGLAEGLRMWSRCHVSIGGHGRVARWSETVKTQDEESGE